MNRFRKLKNDDKGMTLVEVIIAITILGIVVVPVLRSLTTSMAYNAKARVRQELTLTAESIMESFKGYGVNEMVSRFKDGTGLSGLMSGDALNGATYSCTYSDGSVTDADINSSNLSSIPVDADYTFKVSGLVSNNKTYDVEITAKHDSTLDVYVPTDVDSASDAVFMADRSWDTGALDDAKTDFITDTNGYYLTLAGVFEDIRDAEKDSKTKDLEIFITDGTDEYDLTDSTVIKDKVFNDIGSYISLYSREITFTVSGSGDVTYEVEYGYRVSGYPYIIRETTETEDESTGKTVTNVDESSGTLAADKMGVMYFTEQSSTALPSVSGLERLYIYYYPQYSVSGDDTITINIDNSCSPNDLDCYIIKQQAVNLNTTQLQTKESSYRANVVISNSLSKTVNVYHNFDINIGGDSLTAGSSSSVSGASSVHSLSSSDILNSSSALTDEKTLSYTVSLKVTQQDTGSEVTSLESTVIEGID